MYDLKKIGKVFTSKYVRTRPSSYKKRIYRAAVSQGLRNTAMNYWSVKKEALDRIVCRTRYGRGYGPVVRQNEEWMNTRINGVLTWKNTYCLQFLNLQHALDQCDNVKRKYKQVVIDKHQHMHFFIQHYISLECWFH